MAGSRETTSGSGGGTAYRPAVTYYAIGRCWGLEPLQPRSSCSPAASPRRHPAPIALRRAPAQAWPSAAGKQHPPCRLSCAGAYPPRRLPDRHGRSCKSVPAWHGGEPALGRGTRGSAVICPARKAAGLVTATGQAPRCGEVAAPVKCGAFPTVLLFSAEKCAKNHQAQISASRTRKRGRGVGHSTSRINKPPYFLHITQSILKIRFFNVLFLVHICLDVPEDPAP